MPQPKIFLGRVRDKVAIITGAGAADNEIGIGRAIALLLAAEGAKVICADLDLARAEATAEMIRSSNGCAVAQGGDVTSLDDSERFAQAAVGAYGRLDILINNVGIAGPMTLAGVTLAEWHRVIDTNLTSAMLMCRAVVPRMAKNGGGSIVNISSISGMRGMGALAYGPSKAALHQLSREIGILHGRQGIRVNTVAPGHMATPHAKQFMSQEMREKRRKVGPLGIEGDAWDIAHAVLFLASDEARFINGVQLAVDGGVEGIGPLTGAAFLED